MEKPQELFGGRSVDDLLRGFVSGEIAPVAHGKWTTHRTLTHDGEWYCSVCEYEPTVFENTKFCPNCGARMEKEG